ncbi:DinB family protein [Bacillus sp. EB01]|uniref:DinB family protein n=1 Tax=Bacillus sp. EB01 TaxID=1347086 RepID=UPI0005C5912E|nr:DinB family protein [Bacillus sp. EB01]
MNTYCKSTLHQIEIAIYTTASIIDQLEESDLPKRPHPDKFSVGELLGHLATICRADMAISNGATQEEMSHLYASIPYSNLIDIKAALFANFKALEERYKNYTDDELQQETTSYWGVSYTRYEWLLEILAHVYHHRAQLHALLVYCYGKDPEISLFE